MISDKEKKYPHSGSQPSDSCPDCGSVLEKACGCSMCRTCGYSPCG